MATARRYLSLGVPLVCAGILSVTPPVLASEIGLGPCDVSIGPTSSKLTSTIRLRIDRDTAIQTLKHVQRACRSIQDFENNTPAAEKSAIILKLNDLRNKITKNILFPLYVQYPDLHHKAIDLVTMPQAEQCQSTPSVISAPQIKRCEPHMGPATATYLRRTIDDAEHLFTSTVGTQACKSREPTQCIKNIEDTLSEMNFSTTTIYRDYPKLWIAETRESMDRALKEEPRTDKSDAQFRKSAPPRGSVKLSSSALSKVQEFLRSLAQIDKSCEVVSVSWIRGSSSKSPDDAEWTTKGPGLALGSYGCSQVPPDVVDTLGDMKIIFSADDPSRFKGKLVDFEKGEFILQPDDGMKPSSTHSE